MTVKSQLVSANDYHANWHRNEFRCSCLRHPPCVHSTTRPTLSDHKNVPRGADVNLHNPWYTDCHFQIVLSLTPHPCSPPFNCVYSLYLQLQRLYRERADADVAAVEAHLQQLLAEAGSPGRSIPSSEVKHFCKNARNIRVIR